MPRVKIQVFDAGGAGARRDRTLVKTVWRERDSHKKLTSKQAGRILANNFPEFDEVMNRKGLMKRTSGFMHRDH
jgi:hypothetical protein